MPQTMVDPQRLTDAVAGLVVIESINPALVPDGSGELMFLFAARLGLG